MRALAALALTAIALLGTAAGAAGAPPDDLSDDPLDRGALLALPSLYRVEATIHVEALRTRGGRRSLRTSMCCCTRRCRGARSSWGR